MKPGQQRRVRFTKADVQRAVKGALAAKLPIAAVRIDEHGRIEIVSGEPEPVAASTNPLDKWRAQRRDAS